MDSGVPDEGFWERAAVGYSAVVLVVVMVPSGLLMLFGSLLTGSDGCLGYSSECSDRATQAVWIGWAILLVGFCVGFGLSLWRKQLRWTLLGLLFVPLAFRAWHQWFDVYFN